MFRTLHVAAREFASTVLTKGFLIGLLLPPVIMVVMALLIPWLKSLPGPRVSGTIAVIDHSGEAASRIVEKFSPEALAKEAQDRAKQTTEAIKEQTKNLGLDEATAATATQQTAAAAAIVDKGSTAQLAIEILPSDSALEPLKEALKSADARAPTGENGQPGPRKERIAVVVIPKQCVTADSGAGYAGFEMFVAPKLDFEVQERISRRIQNAVVDTRLETSERLRSAGLDPAALRAMLDRPRVEAQAMTAQGAKKTSEVAALLVPVGFMALLLISVMTGGQMLMTTTIEEKGSRVMEVLLSAVSPMQLMTGKVLGQMAASLLLLVVYSGLLIAGLVAFSLQYLLNPINVVYLVVFFFIAFFTIASLLAAVGSAVNELREAQTLMTPVMLLVMMPWFLWMPISRAPNAMFAVIMSFVPVVNPFVMMIRLAGSEPVPFWQIPVSIGIGAATALASAWAAAKIFRIGVLMYGKPPDLKTLVRWVRMA